MARFVLVYGACGGGGCWDGDHAPYLSKTAELAAVLNELAA